ncbi:MAG: glycoside hydrolase family 2 protein [Candidatus Fervidibacter sp.]|uniref:glycoside hydrolase family 2 protein n=1 Tax=Candidatus Fervidibacter sp. TaxID=3100871 RepID=UPI00404AE015
MWRWIFVATVIGTSALVVQVEGANALVPRMEHPRPDFERAQWLNLNGIWEFAFDPNDVGIKERWFASNAPSFPLRIVVPFPWESRLSGIGRKDYKGIAWYRRNFIAPKDWQGKRIWLCFGAIDWHATVWLNGEKVGEHEGGYSEFRFDVTNKIRPSEPNLLVVRVVDYTDHETPIGKQIEWWYTSTSGIWQTVWLEATGQICVNKFRIVSLADKRHVPTGEVQVDILLDWGTDEKNKHETFTVEVCSPTRKFRAAQAKVTPKQEKITLTVKIPNPIFWTPETPHLYEAEIIVRTQTVVHDKVHTYFGIRTVAWGNYAGSQHSFVLLNGKPIYIRGALDQSFNPDGIYTAPSDEFLRRDIELAKSAGFNMLRIHIKADEPRRLYWADKLGILIQQDIPCFYRISERARQSFEKTLKDIIERDFNHPSIYCWTVFNEEWGIGNLRTAPKEHRIDWVLKMVELVRELDPTRLVHDNTGWSHLVTDLNSFHWYGRDVDGFRQHYRTINDERIKPGEDWNYIAGYKQRGEPFVNNEFGYVGAGDGDSDWSWGNLFAVNAMRALDKLVGYTYTELTDIEWEHNGVYNYDRTPKEFGYDFWAPGMTVRDVFAEDFLVLDVPAIKYAKPGEKVQVPVLFSHMSGKNETGLVLKWQIRWLDRFGNWHETKIQSRKCPKTPAYKLTRHGEITFSLPNEPSLVTLVAWLENAQGKRVHINYTQWWVRGESGLPRAEVLDKHTLALRFSPNDWSDSRFSELSMSEVPIEGKHYGRGHGFAEYWLKLPEGVSLDNAQSLTLICEIAAKAGREKIDWVERVNPQDYPQTDVKKFPTTVEVSINGVRIATWHLPDDPADARGVLSHWRGVERGSYGYLMRAEIRLDTPEGVAIVNRLRETGRLGIRFAVPWNAVHRGGLAIYGDTMGCYPVEPTVLLSFTEPLPFPVSWTSHEPVAVNSFRERLQVVLASAQRGGHEWRYTTEQPQENWMQPDFDDSDWKVGKSGFGTEGTPGAIVGTRWSTSDIWLRTTINVPKPSPEDVVWLEVHHDEDCEIYVNGRLFWREASYLTRYKLIRLKPEQISLFREGINTVAVHCRQTVGGQFIDVGFVILRQSR